jgi:hypothetical protein
MHVWYSQEARMYILLALLVALSVGLTWRLLRGRRGWVAYAICTGLALYTHYFSVFVVLAENLFVLAWMARRDVQRQPRRFGVRWLGLQAAVALAFSPWLPVVIYQARFHQMRWVPPLTVLKIAGTPLLMVVGEAGLGVLGVAVFVGLCASIVLMVRRAWMNRRWGQLWGYACAGAWFLVPYVTIALLSLVYPLFHSKQMLLLLTPLLILCAAGLSRLPRPGQIVLIGAWAWVVVSSLLTMYRVEAKDGWREVSAYIQERYRPGDVLYANPAAGVLALDAYFDQSLPHQGYPPEYDVRTGGWEGELLTEAIAEREMTALAAEYQRVWLVEFGSEFWDPEGYMQSWLETNGQRSAERTFGGISVRLYEWVQAAP